MGAAGVCIEHSRSGFPNRRDPVPFVRAIWTFFLALQLVACVGFAPRYDDVLDEKTTAAYEDISKLIAEAEMGKYESASSFDSAADDYATIQALLSVAALRAATLPVPARGTAERARGQLVDMINGCKTAVTTLSGLHKQFGLKPGTGTTASAQVSCDQAARAARAMKGA